MTMMVVTYEMGFARKVANRKERFSKPGVRAQAILVETSVALGVTAALLANIMILIVATPFFASALHVVRTQYC